MKMVLVFDTDDRDGMKSSLKIMKQLADDNGFSEVMSNIDDPRFGKIEFITMLKDFDAYTRKKGSRGTTGEAWTLRTLKDFADEVYNIKRKENRYKRQWC